MSVRRRPWVSYITALVAVGVLGFWALTEPLPLAAGVLPGAPGDPDSGRRIFLIGGCAACHAAKGAEGEARLVLAGGQRFKTEFGTFVAPNVSPHPEAGIGGWSRLDFASALMRGVAPDGRHYYPAFPYTSYARMRVEDVSDLWAYMRTLPMSPEPSAPHEIAFPFNIRRGLGLWKLLYLERAAGPVAALATADETVARGRYLVEGPGHCGECHTPRDGLGGIDRTRWLGGAPSPDGPGRIPNITPAGKRVASWSAEDIAYYLETGFRPDFDTAGGSMVAVIANTSLLPAEDRAAIAAYLKAVPAVAEP